MSDAIRQVRITGSLSPHVANGLSSIAAHNGGGVVFVDLRDAEGRRIYFGPARAVRVDLKSGPTVQIYLEAVLQVVSAAEFRKGRERPGTT